MSIKELVIQLRQLTEAMLSLSIENEDYLIQLEVLQQERSELQKEINIYKSSLKITRWPEDIESVFRECYEMEIRLSKIFLFQKEQATAEINKIGSARKARDLYGTKLSFNHGAYIDRSN